VIHPTSNRSWAWDGCLPDVIVELWGRRWGCRQRDVAGKQGGGVLTWWVLLYRPPTAIPSSVIDVAGVHKVVVVVEWRGRGGRAALKMVVDHST
jgi:hypothetical protein